MRKELLNGLSEEQRKKALGCKNKEELLKLAEEEGVSLTEEQLAAVSGGCGTEEPRKCPNCGSTNIYENHESGREAQAYFECLECGAVWYIR